jgi:hypothetical protein
MAALLTPQAVYDLTKPANQLIIDLINASNGTSLIPDSFSFSIPQATKLKKSNTKITLTPVQGSPYESGDVTVRYRRIQLSDVINNSQTILDATNLATIAELIPQLNTAYQLNLTTTDFIDSPIPSVLSQNELVPIVANPLSLIYVGEAIVNLVIPSDLGHIYGNLIITNTAVIGDLLAYINQHYPSRLLLDANNVTLSVPTPAPSSHSGYGGGIAPVANTNITVTAISDGGYTGTITVNYNRLDLTTVSVNTIQLLSEFPFTEQIILDEFNEQFDLSLTSDDILTISVPSLDIGDITTIDLQAAPDSIGWMGATNVSMLYGLSSNISVLHDFVNNIMPSAGYLQRTIMS